MTTLPSISIPELPRAAAEFTALQAQVARSPQGGVAMMVVVALLLYAADPALGEACLAAAVDEGQLSQIELQRVKLQTAAHPYLARAYIQGATPANGYLLPAPPYVVECSANPYSGDPATGTYKVFVACSGADSPRPATLRRDPQGVWKTREWSSLVVGIRKPPPDYP